MRLRYTIEQDIEDCSQCMVYHSDCGYQWCDIGADEPSDTEIPEDCPIRDEGLR